MRAGPSAVVLLLVAMVLAVAAPAGAQTLFTNSWAELGPKPIAAGTPNVFGQLAPTTGRVTALVVSPNDPDTVFIGASLGGVWRTTDGGAHWTPIFDGARTLAVEELVLVGDTLWVGTGSDAAGGVGLYRIPHAATVAPDELALEGPFDRRISGTGTTVDGTAAPAFSGNAIRAIAVDPNNADRMYVATADRHFHTLSPYSFGLDRAEPGLYYTQNAQAAEPVFSRVAGLPEPGTNERPQRIGDAAFVTGSSDELVVTVIDPVSKWGIYRTANATRPVDDAGAAPEFAAVVTFGGVTPSSGLRADIGVSGDVVYVASSINIGSLWKSVDRGATFVKQPIVAWGVGSHTGGIAVDPSDPDNIYLGGAFTTFRGGGSFRVMVRSTDGGNTMQTADGPYEKRAGFWLAYLHADTVEVAFARSDPDIVYTGNDGGVYRTDNARAEGEGPGIEPGTTDSQLAPVVWEHRNTGGLDITQFYGLAVHPSDPDYTIGATQDNGAVLYRGQDWRIIDGGDVFNVAIDQNATDVENVVIYSDCRRYSSTANALSLTATSLGFNCTKLSWAAQGTGNPTPLYSGINAHSIRQVVPCCRTVYGFTASAMAIVPDGRHIIGTPHGGLGFAEGGNLVGPWPTGHVAAEGWPTGLILAITLDPNDANTAYVGLGGYLKDYIGPAQKAQVWKTTNLLSGAPEWKPAASGLPDLPVRSILVDPADSQLVYLATDSGVYGSSDSGTSWRPLGVGLPRGCTPAEGETSCAVTMQHRSQRSMAFVQPLGQRARLRIATHSRGMWELPLGDRKAPEIIFHTPAQGAVYETGQELTVVFACDDEGGSGVVTCTGSAAIGSSIDTSTPGIRQFTVSTTDAAGNSDSETIEYRIVENAPPAVTVTTPAAGAEYPQGSTVLADYTCSDAGSGIASCEGTVENGSPIDTATLGSHSFKVTARDRAGNEVSSTVVYTVVDRTPPTITVRAPDDGAVYALEERVLADYACDDGSGSGVATCEGDVANGAPLATGDAGEHTFTVDARDNAGNESTQTVRYTVRKATTTLEAAPLVLELKLLSLFVRVGRVSARLTYGPAAKPAAGRRIVFSAGSTPLCTATTGSDGTATCAFGLDGVLRSLLSLGYAARFDGDHNLLPSTAKGPAVRILGLSIPG